MPPSDRTRILLLEDDPGDRRLVFAFLGALPGMHLDPCARLADALELVVGGAHDCAIVDLALPDASGLEIVEQLRVAAPTLALVVLSAEDDEGLALRALALGAQDVLPKPELDARRLSRSLRFAIERQRAELHLAQLALHDPLTGLANRRLFFDRLEQALTRRSRTGGRVAVLFADLDDFKGINDAYGHEAGDELLRQLAGRLQAAVRTSDTVARLGGDEFTVLCEQVGSIDDALYIARRVLAAADAPFDLGHARVTMQLSLGLASAAEEGINSAELLGHADGAMYRAKTGRAGLAVAEPT